MQEKYHLLYGDGNFLQKALKIIFKFVKHLEMCYFKQTHCAVRLCMVFQPPTGRIMIIMLIFPSLNFMFFSLIRIFLIF